MSANYRFPHAADDLLKVVQSPKPYDDSFIKKYWKGTNANSKEQEEALIKQILLVGRKLTQKVHFLKWMVYLHVLVVTRVQFFRLLADEILSMKAPTGHNQGENANVEAKTVQAYFLYLQKRIQSVGIIRTPPKNSNKEQNLQRACLILNLINLGCSSCQQIYKLGKHIGDTLLFLSDVNTIVGRDLRQSYGVLRVFFGRLWNRFHLFNPKAQHILNALSDEISATNEMLFLVFYNTYFFTELQKYLPDWITCQPKDVDDGEADSPQLQKSLEKVSTLEASATAEVITNQQEPISPLRRRASLVRPKQTEISIMEMQRLMRNGAGKDSEASKVPPRAAEQPERNGSLEQPSASCLVNEGFCL